MKATHNELRRLKAEVDAYGRCIGALTMALDRTAERDKQLETLAELQERVGRELEDVKRMETAGSAGRMQGQLIIRGITFGLGVVIAAAQGSVENPFLVGLDPISKTISRDVPYGRAMVGVGPKGVPEGVEVVPISKCARETERTEGAVEEDNRNAGYLLFDPEAFVHLIERLRQQVWEQGDVLPIPGNLLPDYIDS